MKAEALAEKVVDFSSLVTRLVDEGSLKIDRAQFPRSRTTTPAT